MTSTIFIFHFFFVLNALLNEADGVKLNIKGTVKCQNQPYAEVVVKLLEADADVGGIGFNPDDILSNSTTDKEGRYELSGEESERDGLEPYIRIDHTCGNTKKDCWFSDKIYITSKNGTSITEDQNLENFDINLDREPSAGNSSGRVEHCESYDKNNNLPPGQISSGGNATTANKTAINKTDATGAKSIKVHIAGALKCHKKPYAKANVKLMEADTGIPVIDSDDVFDTLTTGKKGHFDVRGEEREQDGLEPYIRIDHSCGAKKDCSFIDQIRFGKIKQDLILADYEISLDHTPSTGSRKEVCDKELLNA